VRFDEGTKEAGTMAFESLSRVKEGYERLQARMHNAAKRNEKAIEQGFAVLETNGGLFGWGYANEKWGDMTDQGVKELRVMGMPADLAAGAGMLGLAFFGGLGKYAEHGINLGNASTGAFSYRMGIEMARKAASTATSGAPQVGAGTEMGYSRGGRQHHVQYAR
jgi:hypothetical protein